MAKSGDVIEVPELGLRFEFRATAEETGGAYTEVDVIGRPKGFIRAMHVHRGQVERHTVIAGAMRVKLHGKTHVLAPGESIEIPADTPHSQLPAGDGPGHIRVRLTPSGQIDGFLEALGQMSYRLGMPKPVAGARFIRDYGATGHAARPSLKTQQRIANAILKLADTEYTFLDEWHVAAPAEDVFDVLADAHTYPEWWKPVYLDVRTEGDFTLQHFKGRLPYHLHTRTRTVESERPYRLKGETDGDLRGTGIWTLAPAGEGTHVRFDWQVHADRRLLKLLTPILRPALRWNHNWAIARAIEGLEPYVRQRAKVAA
jgi:quercetin dioxygenase-like cupin family protein/uncharacterized protein YndB with AHSA1/START domain